MNSVRSGPRTMFVSLLAKYSGNSGTGYSLSPSDDDMKNAFDGLLVLHQLGIPWMQMGRTAGKDLMVQLIKLGKRSDMGRGIEKSLELLLRREVLVIEVASK